MADNRSVLKSIRRDRITLGIAAGCLGVLPGKWANMVEKKLRYTDFDYDQLAAGLFAPKGAIKDPPVKFLGKITNFTNLAFGGVMMTYILSVTGRDKAALKGIGVGSVMWVLIYGITTKTGLTSTKPKRALTPLLSYLDHVGWGACASLLISKFGDDSLFPKKQPQEGQSLPLVGQPAQYQHKEDGIHDH